MGQFGSGPDPTGQRLDVLAFCQYYLPGYKSGGPVRALSNIVNALGDEIDFHIVTRDRDYLESSPYTNVRIDEWNRIGPADVLYLSPGRTGLRGIRRTLGSRAWSLLYVNSFFDPVFSVFPLYAMRFGLVRPLPVLLAPRGEFSPNALGIKPGRKQLYRALFRSLGMASCLTWHSTTDHETRDIRRELGEDLRIVQVPDLAGAPAAEPGMPKRPKHSGTLRLLFLSRIARMKNLAGALEVLRGVEFPVEYHIYGPLDDEPYWKECEDRIAALPANVRVRYHGPVPHDQVGRVYREHDFFFLPTLGENFGHAIVEALSAGCPVVLSDRTPWRKLQRRGVGWDVPLDDIPGFRRALSQCNAMGEAEYAKMSEAARSYGLGACRTEGPARRMAELFRETARGEPFCEPTP